MNRSGYQRITCTQGVAAFELATGDGKRPGYIWRFVRPQLVTIEAEHDGSDPWGFDLSAAFVAPRPVYTVTMRGEANGLFVADMDGYFTTDGGPALHAPTPQLGPGRTR